MKNVRWKKNLLPVVIALWCTLFFSSALQSIASSLKWTEQEHRFQAYGQWNCAVVGESGIGSRLESHAAVEQMGAIRCYANTGSGILVGTVDETAMDLGRLSLLDGHWPEKAKEVAVEAWALLANGYTLDLGNVIMLGNEAYTVCGIIQSYSLGWVINRQAIHAVISEDALLAHGTPEYEIALIAGPYAREEDYTELGFYSGGKVYYNHPAYPLPSSLWEVLQEEVLFLVAYACCLCFTVYSVWVDLRGSRKRSTILYELGATKRQIRKIFLKEYLLIWAAGCVLLTFVGCGAAWVFTRYVRAVSGVEMRFHMSAPRLVLGCLVTGVALVAATLRPIVQTGAEKKGYRRTYRSFMGLRRFAGLSARRLRMRLPRTMGRVFCYFVILCTGVLALQTIAEEYTYYCDAIKTSEHAYRWSDEWSGEYVSEDMLYSAKGIDGLSVVDGYAWLRFMHNYTEAPPRVMWEGCQGSAYWQTICDSFRLYAIDDSLWEYITGSYGMTRDKTAWERGESALIVLLPLMEGENGYRGILSADQASEMDLLTEETLSQGDSLTVTLLEQEDRSFRVDGIIENTPLEMVSARSAYFPSGAVLVSQTAMQELTGQSGYNNIWAYGDIDAMSFAVTDRLAARFAQESGMELHNNRERLLQLRRNMLLSTSQTFAIALLVLLSTIVILANGAQLGCTADQKGNTILWALGATRKNIAGLYVRECVTVFACAMLLSALTIYFVDIEPWIRLYMSEPYNLSCRLALRSFFQNALLYIPQWVYWLTLFAVALQPFAAELVPIQKRLTMHV